MMREREQHVDVAAYALGVLDERDAARFEDHLADCAACALELETLLPVVDVLADVDADAMVGTEQSRRESAVLHAMMTEVTRERQHVHRRRLYSLAAAVVLFAMLAVGALFAGATWFAPGRPGSQPTTAQRSSTQLDPLPLSDGGAGIGGPDLPGERYGGSDPRTGVRLDAGLERKDWGTQVSFAVSNIKGPLTCRLVAVRTDGSTEVLSTWTVNEKGWGTAANPAPLLLQAVTATPRDSIAHLQVQSVAADGTGATLVRVP
jgi:Putative zinc-finger